MLVHLALAAMLIAGPTLLVGHVPAGLVAVPPESGAQVLTDTTTAQAVVADLDGDGSREVVALTDAEGGMRIEAWTETDGTWSAAEPVALELPGADRPDEVDPERGPIRLHVRRDGDRDRVTLARQPVGIEPDFSDPCCLEIDDVVLGDGALRLERVAEPIDAVGALRVVDLDGDGVDELFASRSLPPLGDIGFPIETLVFRWNGTRFDPPALQELPVGSGDTPFLLGDSDGRPGDELGIIATIGRAAFYRVSLRVDGTLGVEDSLLVRLPEHAMAVPVPGGSAVATLTASGTLEVRRWPAGDRIGEPEGQLTGLSGARLLGSVMAGTRPHLVVRHPAGDDELRLLELPALRPIPSGAPRGAAAPAFVGAAPVVPYVGAIPGGRGGGRAVLAAGWLVMDVDAPPDWLWRRAAILPAAVPAGFAGDDDAWMVIHHLPMGVPSDPTGGRLDPPLRATGSGITVAPFSSVAQAERDDTLLVPEVTGRRYVADDGTLTVTPQGFTAIVEAPPGSRVYTAAIDPTVVSAVVVVGEEGVAEVWLRPPTTGTPDPRYRAALSVTTPAGHGYVATWSVRVVTEPPRLEAVASTPIGSIDAVVSGSVAPDATVRVDGRPIEVGAGGRFETRVPVAPWPTEVVVTATDRLGNESRQVVTAIGILDVRQLPWVPIAAVGVALVALALAVWVPRSRPVRVPRDDDVVLEELDPGE